jgi:hypothetical protein
VTFTHTLIDLMNRIAVRLAGRSEIQLAVDAVPGCWNTTTLTTQLPAALEDTCFEAEFTVDWQVVSSRELECDPEYLVKAQAARIVRGCAANALVTEVEEVEAEANQYLAVLRGPGFLGHGRVALTASEEHTEATRLHQTLLRRLRTSQIERLIASDEREHLRTRIFTDRRTALLWWIQQDPNRAGRLHELDAMLSYYHGEDGSPGAETDEDTELRRLRSRLLQLDQASRDYLLRQFQTLIDAVNEGTPTIA